MKNCLAILFGIGVLYCLAYLPSFVCFVFIGQYLLPLFGNSQRIIFLVLNSTFVILTITWIYFGHKKEI